MRIGLVGGGIMGGMHLEAYSNIPGTEVVLCEVDAERRESCVERFWCRDSEQLR